MQEPPGVSLDVPTGTARQLGYKRPHACPGVRLQRAFVEQLPSDRALRRHPLRSRLGGTARADDTPELRFTKTTLPNGMTVILHEDHALPQVVVNIGFRTGSRTEQPRRTGFAHLFEHLMFMGTRRAPTRMFDLWMSSAGGREQRLHHRRRHRLLRRGTAPPRSRCSCGSSGSASVIVAVRSPVRSTPRTRSARPA